MRGCVLKNIVDTSIPHMSLKIPIKIGISILGFKAIFFLTVFEDNGSLQTEKAVSP